MDTLFVSLISLTGLNWLFNSVGFLINSFLYLSRSLSRSRIFSFSLSFLGSFSKKDFSTFGSVMTSLDLFSLGLLSFGFSSFNVLAYFIVFVWDNDFSKARVLLVSQSISQFGSFAISS